MKMVSKRDPYAVTVLVLAALALVLFAYPALRVTAGFELDYNEGWNVVLQSLVKTGANPYVDAGPWFFNNYPPLSFYLVAALGALVGGPLVAGRLVSVLAVAVIALSCARLVRASGARRADAGLAGATCLALFAAFATDYVGIDDPQLLAQALLCCGFALYVDAPPTARRMAAIAALFAAGLLCKHNVLTLPLVVSLHALARAPMRAKLALFGTGTVLAAIAGLVIHLAFGPAFFTQLLAGRLYDGARGFMLTIEVLGRLHAPLAIAALFLVLGPRTPLNAKLAAYLIGGLVLGMGFSGGAGVDINIFFDVMIAISIAAGLACAHLRSLGAKPAVIAALALLANAAVISFAPQALGRAVVEFIGDFGLREKMVKDDTAYLAAHPGSALCESMLLCLWAGKPVLVDPYNLLQASATGRLPATLLEDMLKRRDFAVIQLQSRREHPLDEAEGLQGAPQRFVNFADPVFDAVDKYYRLDRVGGMGRFYVPKNP
jgi:hypothetical protein